MHKNKNAFTLIEVMIAVMIISIVIMALLQIQGNTTRIFSKLSSTLNINQYTSFFVSNKDYGFENQSIALNNMLSEFIIEDDLRRKLKTIKVHINYKELKSIDMNENQEGNIGTIFELGRTFLKVDDSSTSILRLKIQ